MTLSNQHLFLDILGDAIQIGCFQGTLTDGGRLSTVDLLIEVACFVK